MMRMIVDSRAIYFGLMTALCFSLMNLCVKEIAYLPAQEIVLARSLMTVSIIYLTLRWRGVSIWGQASTQSDLYIRGIAGYISLSCYMYALTRLDLGVATFIQYMSPIFSGIFAFFVLGERLYSRHLICLVCGLLGMAVMTHIWSFGSSDYDLWGIVSCFTSVIFSGIAYTFVRKMTLQKEDTDVIIFYFSFLSLPISLIWTCLHHTMPIGLHGWLWLLGVGIFSHLGQICLTHSFRYAQAATATNMLYLTPILATIWGVVFLGETISGYFMMGAVMILGSQYWLLQRR